jgi:hypothetical protein
MHKNLILDNQLTDYGLVIGCGLIIGFSLLYLIISHYKAIPSENMEALTHETMEAISNEDSHLRDISNKNIDSNLTDSDSSTDSESDHDTVFDSDSSSDTDTENVEEQLEIYYLPFVDLDVCSIQELKLFEIHSLYSKQIAENNLTDEDLMEIISFFTDAELCSIYVNQWIIVAIEHFYL